MGMRGGMKPRMRERRDRVVRREWGVVGQGGRAVTHHSPLPTRQTRWSGLAAFTLVLATGLTACSFAPPHGRPPLPTPVAYDPSTNATAGIRPVDVGWRDFFPDPRLAALIEAALAHNRDLAISVAR